MPLDGMAVFVNGEQQLLPEATDGVASLRIAFEAPASPRRSETRQRWGASWRATLRCKAETRPLPWPSTRRDQRRSSWHAGARGGRCPRRCSTDGSQLPGTPKPCRSWAVTPGGGAREGARAYDAGPCALALRSARRPKLRVLSPRAAARRQLCRTPTLTLTPTLTPT